MHSCLYEGQVKHLRRTPVEHAFDYRLMMAYLDLEELEGLVGPRALFSNRRFALASFLTRDHLSGLPEESSLSAAIRTLVENASGHRPTGPIRLLTQLRYCGHYFSPLNLYYCFEADGAREGEQVEAIVAEVSNTPWKERHHYVLHAGNQLPQPGLRYQHPKGFHVSPFMGMEATYDWRLNTPDKVLYAQIKSSTQDGKPFEATMVLHRRELSRHPVRRMLLRYPLMNAKIVLAIYWQAFLLWKKKCPFFPHPETHEPRT